ncbi:hypothetical protein A0J57_00445 [Sphingobium sp. 22B]|nr:hypothetical protein [Sphingobium sp. RSMS]AJR25310.1 hypothetical protein TZ53_17840 [Sphingobium sp. YBL2]KXU33155.1 hypothetical protein AXW74_04125 [Sphingobium sp. AM]KYC34396.1 hypothetical protein A0J57_00445 [Sphingobium sp. 22B]OAP32366.1 hypothetical protein A8O16_08915 [Sphingobium sp. 20006FA]
MTRQMIFVCLLIMSSLYAFARGGRPEQIAAATLVLGVLASIAFVQPSAARFRFVEAGILGVDLAMLGVFLALSFRSTRFWPIWIAGILGSEVVVHLTRAIVPDIVPEAYMEAAGFWSWVAQTMLIAATWRHRGRLRRNGSDDPWRTDC